jgi:hypothetical protein
LKKRPFAIVKTAVSTAGCVLLLASCKTAPAVSTAPPEVSPTVSVPVPTGEPVFSLGEKYVRYYGETVKEFIPAEYPASVVPFLGGVISVDTGFGIPGGISKYGFCLETGEVICDPYYSYVEQLSVGEKTVYIARKPLEKQENSFFMEYAFTVITSDGKTAIKAERAGFLGEAADTGFLLINIGGKFGVVDFDANEVLSYIYDTAPIYSDGLFLIVESVFSEDGYLSYWYIDEKGEQFGEKKSIRKTVLERAGLLENDFSYPDVLSFLAYSDGFAPYVTDDGLYGYIDKAGSVAIPAQFPLTHEGAGVFIDGAAIIDWRQYSPVDTKNPVYSVINKDGWEFIPKTTGVIIRDNGMLAVSSYDASLPVEFYSPSGDLIYRTENYNTVMSVGYGLFRQSYIGEDGIEQGGALIRAENGRESELLYEYALDQTEAEPSFQWDHETGALVLTEYVSDGEFTYQRVKIFDEAGVMTASFTDEFSGYDWVYISQIHGKKDGFSEPAVEFFLVKTGKNGEELYECAFYTMSGKKVFDSGYKTAVPVFGGKYFVVQKGLYTGVIDANGQWLVKCTALDYMAD